MKNGNQRNFNGVVMRVQGNDIALNSMLDDLDFVSGVKVLSRTEITACAGEITLQLSAHARSKVSELWKRDGVEAYDVPTKGTSRIITFENEDTGRSIIDVMDGGSAIILRIMEKEVK